MPTTWIVTRHAGAIDWLKTRGIEGQQRDHLDTSLVSQGDTVIGTLRLVGDWAEPKPGFEAIFEEMKHMGQEILNPPSVEGWHTGKEFAP